jgi:hypothetical protein
VATSLCTAPKTCQRETQINVGATRQLTYFFVDRLRGERIETAISFASDDPVAEFLGMLLARDAAVAGPPDLLNRCDRSPCTRPGASAAERRVEAALQPLAGVLGPQVAPSDPVGCVSLASNTETHQGGR